MQILFLSDKNTDIQYLESMLNYDKSLSKNILSLQNKIRTS